MLIWRVIVVSNIWRVKVVVPFQLCLLCTFLWQIHSIHQRRQVVGRSKNFDQLVTELKMCSKARERAPVLREPLETEQPCSETPLSQTGPPHCKRQPNCINLRYEQLDEEVHKSNHIKMCLPLLNSNNQSAVGTEIDSHLSL